MDEFFSRVFADLVGRVHGPMNVRLYIQTLVAAVLAIRAGLRDARLGNPPFFWSLFFDPEQRSQLLRSGWKDIANLFCVALALDIVYQVIELRTVYPGEAIVVALLLAVVPYLILRAPVTRLFARKKVVT